MQRSTGPWVRSLVFGGACIVLALAARSPLSTNAQVDANSPSGEPTEPPPSPVRPSAAEMESVIRDIQRIRREVGNSPLQGSFLETIRLPEPREGESLDEFGAQLRREFVPDSDPAPQAPQAGAATPTNPVHTDPATLEYYRRSLRSLGRRLDAIAQDLEELSLLEEADRIRATRAQLQQRLPDEGAGPLRRGSGPSEPVTP